MDATLQNCEDDCLGANMKAKSRTQPLNHSNTKRVHHRKRNHYGTPVAGKESDVNPGEDEQDEDVLPSNSIWIIHLATIITRLIIVSDKSSWWILHPDEVFQTIEVAHSEVYGYGFRPYEYLPPPPANTTHTPTLQEAALGMYSLRSFLLPRIYMIVLYLKEVLCLQTSPFLTAKLFHGLVSAHLPASVYFFLRQISPCRDVCIISATLVSVSEHLITLGTHTLVNSLLSPLVFLALGWFIKLEKTRDATSREGSPRHSGTNSKHLSLVNRGTFSREPDETELARGGVDDAWRLFYHGEKTLLPDSGAVGDISLSSGQNLHRYDDMRRYIEKMCCGCLIGILLYVRIDLMMLVAATVFMFYICDGTITKNLSSLVQYGLGFACGVLLGGWDDRGSYGVWFLSPLQWYKFNVHHDLATLMFGWETSTFYVEEMSLSNFYSILQSVILFLSVIVLAQKLLRFQKLVPLQRKMLLFLLLQVFLLAVYSLKGHKEFRFIHNVFVLNLVTFSFSLCFLCQIGSELFRVNNLKPIVFAVILSCSLLRLYCINSEKYLRKWSYRGDFSSGNVNGCLDYIRQQTDVKGVFLDRTIHMTGGYTILHKNVPIFAQVHFEYHEYGMLARKKLPANSRMVVHQGDVNEVAVLSKITNYVTVENSPLVLKYLFDDDVYNYIVTGRNGSIFSPGFSAVYTSGGLQVLKRQIHQVATTSSMNRARGIPIGTNATVLEYEGSWLYTYGLYRKAIERLEVALQLDKTRIKVYQLLSLSYKDMGKIPLANQVISQCMQIYKNSCLEPQPKVILHSDLDIDVKI